MKTVTFTELRNNARHFFDLVEDGETLEITRHGKPVAVLSPTRSQGMDRWRTARPLDLGGVSLSRVILDQRQED